MKGVLERVAADGTLGARGAAVPAVIGRLESGEAPAEVAAALGLEPADIIAAVAHDGLGGNDSGGLGLEQSPPRRPRLQPALGEVALAGLFPAASRPARLALAAGLLQVADFWEASHQAAQQADDLGESAHSACWHGIAHRREPDPGNASYWFRRVGRHPLFPHLARVARPVLAAAGADPALTARLLPREVWDPFAFIDLCSRPRAAAGLARALQRLEFDLLLAMTIPS